MIWFRKGIVVVRIPSLLVTVLMLLWNCRKTSLSGVQSICLHAHGFLALYFTRSVRLLRLADEVVELPRSAAVIVRRGSEHGWTGVQNGATRGVVAHFHKGHDAHDVVGA